MSNWSIQDGFVAAVTRGDLELMLRLWEGEKPPPGFNIESLLDRCEMWERMCWIRAIERYGPCWAYFGNLATLIMDRSRRRATFGIQHATIGAVLNAHASAAAALLGLGLLWCRYYVPGASYFIGLQPMRLVVRAL